MIEKIFAKASDIKVDWHALLQAGGQRIKNELVRSPIKDQCEFMLKSKSFKNLKIKLGQVMDSWSSNKELVELLKGDIFKYVNEENIDAIVRMAKISDNNKRPIYWDSLEEFARAINSKNKEFAIKMAEKKNLEGHFVERLYPSHIFEYTGLSDALQHKFIGVSDEKILDYIKKVNLNADSPNTVINNLKKANNLLDVYHTFNNNYSHIDSECRFSLADYRYSSVSTQNYYRFVQKHPESISGGKNELIKSGGKFEEAFRHEERLERMKKYCEENTNDEFSNYFYNKYYLESELIQDKELRKMCSGINDKYGVKVFLSHGNPDDVLALKYIDAELSEWERASEGAAKKPPIIDLSTINTLYIDNKAACEKGKAQGCAKASTTKAISANGGNSLISSLRHEMFHINDTKLGKNIPPEYDLDKIMPKKVEIRDVEKIWVPDVDSAPYGEEFSYAGLSTDEFKYALNNTKEYGAVASEGAMRGYSSGFKQMLIDFGAPEWIFDLMPKDELIYKIKSGHEWSLNAQRLINKIKSGHEWSLNAQGFNEVGFRQSKRSEVDLWQSKSKEAFLTGKDKKVNEVAKVMNNNIMNGNKKQKPNESIVKLFKNENKKKDFFKE